MVAGLAYVDEDGMFDDNKDKPNSRAGPYLKAALGTRCPAAAMWGKNVFFGPMVIFGGVDEYGNARSIGKNTLAQITSLTRVP